MKSKPGLEAGCSDNHQVVGTTSRQALWDSPDPQPVAFQSMVWQLARAERPVTAVVALRSSMVRDLRFRCGGLSTNRRLFRQ